MGLRVMAYIPVVWSELAGFIVFWGDEFPECRHYNYDACNKQDPASRFGSGLLQKEVVQGQDLVQCNRQKEKCHVNQGRWYVYAGMIFLLHLESACA